MPIEELRRRTAAFESAIRRRNRQEYGTAAFVAAACLYMLYFSRESYIRLGSVLVLVGISLVCFNLHGKGSAPRPADAAAASRHWYRKELERQRDLLDGIWKWYLGPLIPGLAMWLAGGLWQHPERWRAPLISSAIAAALFIAIAWWNGKTARKLDREISSL